jgi:hypothetical protein
MAWASRSKTMIDTNAAAVNSRPTIGGGDDRWPSAYTQVLTRGAYEARSVEGDSGYWASVIGTLIAAAVIGIAVLTIISIA